MAPQLGLLQPTRDRALEHPRPARTKPSSGDDEDASAAGITTGPDEGGKLPVRLQLSPDFQYARNPGFNADRGPVRFYAIRVHVDY